MRRISAKCFTRVTLALDIIGKIASGPYAGFHELAAIKHKIDLHDILTIEESPSTKIACNLPQVPCGPSNICWKVLDIVKAEFGLAGNVAITLEKRIPVQGGLAGGSADAAAMFLLLRDFWGLDLSGSRLITLARKAGMDVPFYFSGTTALDTEAGGILEPVDTKLRFDMILVTPDFGVSTAQAYKGIDYSRIGHNKPQTIAMKESLQSNDRAAVTSAMHNDFELSVFGEHPKLPVIKRLLLEAGCENAMLSGSGSTVIGILPAAADFDKIQSTIGFRSLLVSSCSESSDVNIQED
jgi:4-diphosphocytidyl-2-C-methyl-D-erythritol kinase